MAPPPGLRPEEACSGENLLRVLISHCRDGDNSLYFQASRLDSFAGSPAPLTETTSVRSQSSITLLFLALIFILRCDQNGHARLISRLLVIRGFRQLESTLRGLQGDLRRPPVQRPRCKIRFESAATAEPGRVERKQVKKNHPSGQVGKRDQQQ
jgi:hypothetical protein